MSMRSLTSTAALAGRAMAAKRGLVSMRSSLNDTGVSGYLDNVEVSVGGDTTVDLSDLTWRNALVNNLLPVTIGNVIGGAVMVGAVYWLVYLRPRPAP